MVSENGQKQKQYVSFKVGTLQDSTSQDTRLELPIWVEHLKGTDFEIHNLFLFLIVLGDHWELEARRELAPEEKCENQHDPFPKTQLFQNAN